MTWQNKWFLTLISHQTPDATEPITSSYRTLYITINTPYLSPSQAPFTVRDCKGQPTRGSGVLSTHYLPICRMSHYLAESCTWPVTGETLVTRIGYDSRSNQTLVIDPKGNTAVAAYDGASRAIESIQHLREDGNGGPPPANATLLADGGATIRTVTVYDTNSRVIELIDDRGASTLYTYDTLDRQTAVTFHDGSTRTIDYDAVDVTDYTDENGSVSEYTYDAIGRLAAVAITPASDVIGTTAQSSQYDGLSRRTQAIDTSGSNAAVDIVYDSLSRIVEEKQAYGNTRYATHTAFKSLPITELTYPNDRIIDYTYDSLYRRTGIEEDPASIAAWYFFGPGRVAELMLGNGLICTHMNNARTNTALQADVANPAWGDQDSDRLGYDGAGRMITKRYLNATASATGYTGGDGTKAKAGFTTTYDHASNKLYERHVHAESRSHAYPSLDSMDRLVQYQRGTLQQAADGTAAVATGITLPGVDSDRSYRLDGVGNWQRTAYTAVGSAGTTEVRQHNHVNQLTKFGTTKVWYDGAPYAQAAMDLEPTAYWRLGEYSGTTADDETGNHDGTYTPGSGEPEEWTGGTLEELGALVGSNNTSADFNGSTGHVSVDYHADFNFGTTMTAIAWVKAVPQEDKTVAAQWDVDVTPPKQGSWRFHSGPSGDSHSAKIQVDLTDDGTFGDGHQRSFRSSVDVFNNDNEWHMIAFTFDNGTVRLFVDGDEDLDAIAVFDDNVTSLYDSTAAVTLAAHLSNGSAAGYLVGTLDEVAVFAKALTAGQIKELHQIGTRAIPGAAGSGNVIDDGTRVYVYDALNRVVRARRKSDNEVIAEYMYDAFGRRIRKVVDDGGLPEDNGLDGTTDFLYSGIQCIEERDVSNDPIRQYVWGAYVDELIQQRNINDPAVDYYPLSDLLYRTVALTNASKTIVEAYDCDAYGNTLIFEDTEPHRDTWFTDADADHPTLAPKCSFIFTGRRYDADLSDATSQMYFYRARYYNGTLGRFISRDPIGYAGGMGLYQIVRGNPTTATDPVGLKPPPPMTTWEHMLTWANDGFSVTGGDEGLTDIEIVGQSRGSVESGDALEVFWTTLMVTDIPVHGCKDKKRVDVDELYVLRKFACRKGEALRIGVASRTTGKALGKMKQDFIHGTLGFGRLQGQKYLDRETDWLETFGLSVDYTCVGHTFDIGSVPLPALPYLPSSFSVFDTGSVEVNIGGEVNVSSDDRLGGEAYGGLAVTIETADRPILPRLRLDVGAACQDQYGDSSVENVLRSGSYGSGSLTATIFEIGGIRLDYSDYVNMINSGQRHGAFRLVYSIDF